MEYTLSIQSRGPNLAETRVIAFLIEHLRYTGLYLILFGAGHGVKIVFGARHVIGLRAAACLGIPAGFGLAFAFADRVESVLADVHRVERWLALAAVLALAAWLAVRAHRGGRRA